jgi:hypothetical protein
MDFQPQKYVITNCVNIAFNIFCYECKGFVAAEWRRLHIEELNDLYFSPNIVRAIKLRRIRWAWHVTRIGKWRDIYKVLVRKPEGKRPFERPRRRWEDNIKTDLQEVRCETMDWIELARDRDT